ncbi:uncharacterized protein H6S33_004961 [Morchella sextelata]|uniref:uncharacterized protein n=1 Tax=Morchella sextelata TaxID=1174677 RepID=UPI001D0571A9|nr:uncharacterized protein H6S33_004961 [Morchella sextelata]KAH0604979.1 hypothetical protein H6S33_004961 [Morchella sextelata]
MDRNSQDTIYSRDSSNSTIDGNHEPNNTTEPNRRTILLLTSLLAQRPGEIILISPFGQQGDHAINTYSIVPGTGTQQEFPSSDNQAGLNIYGSLFSGGLDSSFQIHTSPIDLETNYALGGESQDPSTVFNDAGNSTSVYSVTAYDGRGSVIPPLTDISGNIRLARYPIQTQAESTPINYRDSLVETAESQAGSVSDRRDPDKFWNLPGYRKVRNDFNLLDCFENCQKARWGDNGFWKRHNLVYHLRRYHGQDIPWGAPIESE